QLEDLLRKDCRRPVQVVNLGVAGIYTDSIAQNLEGQLDRYRPRLLVVMMGINDPRQLGEPGQSDWLHELRLFKLVQWIVASLGDGRIGDHVLPGDTPEAILARMRAFRDRNPSNPPLLDNNDYLVKVTALLGGLSSADVMRFHRQVLSIYPAHKAAWNQLGLTYRYLGDLRNAVEAHRKAADLETNPNSVWYRTQLALDYAELKDGKSFMEEARKVTRIPGKRKDTPYYQALDALLQGALKMRDYAGFKVLLRREFSENPHNEMLLGYRKNLGHLGIPGAVALVPASPEGFSTATRQNYRLLLETALDRGVSVASMQYPVRDAGVLREMVTAVPPRSSARAFVIDNSWVFNEAVERFGYAKVFLDSFGGDFGHLTMLGNTILAKHAAEEIRSGWPEFKSWCVQRSE
ncbi:MAG: hypothetical protein ACXVB9_08450, partial [Bdellovibrionota bacterium]